MLRGILRQFDKHTFDRMLLLVVTPMVGDPGFRRDFDGDIPDFIFRLVIIEAACHEKTSQFRIRATKVLKEYLLRGYSINQRLMQIENRMDQRFLEHDKRLDDLKVKVDFFVRTSLRPKEGILFDGRIFDAYALVCDLIQSARSRIIVIDGYADHSVLRQFDKRNKGVTAEIYTSEKNEGIKNDHKRHNAQYPPIDLKYYRKVHDRFLIIDDSVYLIGASLKDLGKSLFGFFKMESMTPEDLLSGIKVKK